MIDPKQVKKFHYYKRVRVGLEILKRHWLYTLLLALCTISLICNAAIFLIYHTVNGVGGAYLFYAALSLYGIMVLAAIGIAVKHAGRLNFNLR